MTTGRPAQELIQQISMYQEVQSCSGPGMPFIGRAIVLWTFRAALPGEEAQVTWCYVDAISLRLSMSPSTHLRHQLSTTLDNDFNGWGNGPSQPQQDVLDHYVQGLLTPPSTDRLRSSFLAHSYGYHDQQFDIPANNFNFGSNSTINKESAQVSVDTNDNIDNFLANTANVSLVDYNKSLTHWNISHTESLISGPTWVNCATIPSNTPFIESQSETENTLWPIAADPRLINWTRCGDNKGDSDPAKPKDVFTEQNDDKTFPWFHSADNDTNNIYIEDHEPQFRKLSAVEAHMKDPSWMGSDTSLDFSQLVGGLGS